MVQEGHFPNRCIVYTEHFTCFNSLRLLDMENINFDFWIIPVIGK